MDMLLLDAPTCTQILDSDMGMGSFSAADAVIQSLDANVSNYGEPFKLEFADDDNTSLQLRKRSPVRHQCTVCEKSFTGKVYLNLHKRLVGDCKITHTEPTNGAIFAPTQKKGRKKNYKCSECDKTFRSPYHLNRHAGSHKEKPIKDYICKICDRRYVAPQYLRCHMLSHSNESPYTCATCNVTFTGKEYLRMHSRLHLNENKYKCELCDDTFVSKPYLKLHMYKHKEFKCDACGRQFRSKSEIEHHKKSCEVNQKSTRSVLGKDCKKVHRESVSVERPHKCEQCDGSFILKLNLDLHLKVEHGIERKTVCENENEKKDS